jgi:hypothetical protein
MIGYQSTGMTGLRCYPPSLIIGSPSSKIGTIEGNEANPKSHAIT